MAKYIIEKIEIDDIEYDIYIGKNALGNNEIIKISHPDSIWFHFDDISSPHIILDNKGNKVDKSTLKKIGNMLFQYKNALKKSKIIYTKIKNLKLTKEIGSVIPINYEYL
jgi:predicted ribosome quality control (RQC) complex YloA/Tae2 family protein